MKKKVEYLITNYGGTRSVFIAGQRWRIAKGESLPTIEKEVADAFDKLQFVDVKKIKQSKKKKTLKKKKRTTKKKTKKLKLRKK